MARSRIQLCIAAGIVYFGSASAAPAGAAAEAPPPELGIWAEQNYSFVHLGFTATYSCDGLADKLTYLLRAAGARADIQARALGCDMQQVATIGDGANDIPMLKKAGTGIGYFGKPAVVEATPHQIRHTDLVSVLYMQGYRQAELA